MRALGSGLLLLLSLGAFAAEPRDIRVTGASSSLAGKTQIMDWSAGKPHWADATFQPGSAMDGSLATSWCEGARGSGIGEWIELQVDHPVHEIEIAGGFRKVSLGPGPGREKFSEEQLDAWFDQSLRTYKSNGRPAVVELTTEEGQVLERFQMGDRTLSEYRFPVSLPPGKYRLRIAQVYPGTRFEDTCIAELQFHDARGPEPIDPQWLPESLRPFAGPARCRAASNVKVLPSEVRFVGMTVDPSPGPGSRPSSARINLAARGPSGVLSPVTDLSCFWGQRFVCVVDGVDDIRSDEALDSGDSVSAWTVHLERSTADAADPRAWTGGYQAIGEPSPSLTFQLGSRPDGKHGTAFFISARRDNAVVETAQYTCAPGR